MTWIRIGWLVWAAAALAAAQAPKFEVASIKACKPGEKIPGGGDSGGSGKTAVAPTAESPGTLVLYCLPLRSLILMAYFTFSGEQGSSPRLLAPKIEGGPDWIQSDTYGITAKSADAVGRATMRGPMLRALLEDRFKLKVRHESREGPVFDLTVAKGGLKMRPTAVGSCVVPDPHQSPRPEKAPGDKPWCGIHYRSSMQTMSGILDGIGATMPEIAAYLYTDGKAVIDKTEVEGRFDFHLEYLRGGGPPPEDGDPAHAAPSIFTAVQQLGLRMEAAKGPVEFVVIDHVERPTEN